MLWHAAWIPDGLGPSINVANDPKKGPGSAEEHAAGPFSQLYSPPPLKEHHSLLGTAVALRDVVDVRACDQHHRPGGSIGDASFIVYGQRQCHRFAQAFALALSHGK
jgi:hypothetical protein